MTGKQRAGLRKMANGIETILYIGKEGVTDLPESNVLYFELTDDAWVCVRPSGTEPKVKLYCGVRGDSNEEAAAKEGVMVEKLNALMDSF